jgi:hypothetical protein
MPWAGFERTIPVFEREKTVHFLDVAATVIVEKEIIYRRYKWWIQCMVWVLLSAQKLRFVLVSLSSMRKYQCSALKRAKFSPFYIFRNHSYHSEPSSRSAPRNWKRAFTKLRKNKNVEVALKWMAACWTTEGLFHERAWNFPFSAKSRPNLASAWPASPP